MLSYLALAKRSGCPAEDSTTVLYHHGQTDQLERNKIEENTHNSRLILSIMSRSPQQ